MRFRFVIALDEQINAQEFAKYYLLFGEGQINTLPFIFKQQINFAVTSLPTELAKPGIYKFDGYKFFIKPLESLPSPNLIHIGKLIKSIHQIIKQQQQQHFYWMIPKFGFAIHYYHRISGRTNFLGLLCKGKECINDCNVFIVHLNSLHGDNNDNNNNNNNNNQNDAESVADGAILSLKLNRGSKDNNNNNLHDVNKNGPQSLPPSVWFFFLCL